MNWRKILLIVHLYVGLTAGIFLAILGLTGSIIALDEDIDHWLHPELWYVTEGRRALPENDLVSTAQNRFPRARVFFVEFPRSPNLAQLMQMTDGTAVYINPYDATILGSTVGRSNSDLTLAYLRQIHLRLLPDSDWTPKLGTPGRIIVSLASLLLCVQVPIGVVLWWRKKQAAIHFKATDFKVPWSKLFHDAHQAIGIYAALFLMILAFTGVVIGFDFGPKMIYAVTRSAPPAAPASYPSTVIAGANPLMADRVLEIARGALPGAATAMLVMPLRANGAFSVLMRVPEETSRNVHSVVTIDQYSGKVLFMRDFAKGSAGYRLIRLNRAIHTGDIFGLASRIILSLASLMLVAMVITGMVIWWKKLAMA
jgi:uncharacterized iron-regulated membrane protein